MRAVVSPEVGRLETRGGPEPEVRPGDEFAGTVVEVEEGVEGVLR